MCYDLGDVAGMGVVYTLHDVARVSWIGICTIQIMHNISER